VTKGANRGDSLVVTVVMDHGYISLHGGGGEQQVSRRDSAMVASTGQSKLRLPCVRPEAGWHRNRLKSCEATGNLLRTLLIRSKTSQLKDNQIADEHQPCPHSDVEPLRKPRKTSVSNPGPNARIEKSWAIELRKLQLGHGTQARSRPAATS
jgi:hypothetical protein